MSEVKKVVNELNEHIFEISEDVDYVLWLEYCETPIGDYVKYAGQYIFDSENDYRPYIDEDEGIRQGLKEYLLEQMFLIKSFISRSITKINEDV